MKKIVLSFSLILALSAKSQDTTLYTVKGNSAFWQFILTALAKSDVSAREINYVDGVIRGQLVPQITLVEKERAKTDSINKVEATKPKKEKPKN